MEDINVGDRIKFVSEKQTYRVCAADKRFLVCTKPFNPRKTVIYTIVDREKDVRGPDNKIFSAGYETEADTSRALEKLQAGEIAVSDRHGVPLDIEKIIPRKNMAIKVLYTPDCDLWGIYTLGHVAKFEFLEQVRDDDQASVDLNDMERDGGGALTAVDDVHHAYMRQGNDHSDDPELWDWCASDDEGAVAITAISADC